MAYKDKEKQKAFQRQWKRKLNLSNKLKAIEILGGKCSVSDCQITDFRCLEFDHIKPELRKPGISSATRTAAQIVNGTLTKDIVQLLCANHHAIKTYQEDRKLFGNYIK